MLFAMDPKGSAKYHRRNFVTSQCSCFSGAIVHGTTTGGQSDVCIQAIFNLLDNLGQWVGNLKQEIALSQSSHDMPGKLAG